MSHPISLPLHTVSHSTYLGEVILHENVYQWVKKHSLGAFRSGLGGPITHSATRPTSFGMAYDAVQPYIAFEKPEVAQEFLKKWCLK